MCVLFFEGSKLILADASPGSVSIPCKSHPMVEDVSDANSSPEVILTNLVKINHSTIVRLMPASLCLNIVRFLCYQTQFPPLQPACNFSI